MDKEELPIHQRLKDVIKNLADGKQARFAERVGISTGAVGDIFGNRKSKPGYDLLVKILDAYSELRAEWLMRGQGEMLKAPTSNAGAQEISLYMRTTPQAGVADPGLAANLVSQLPTEEKPGPGDINIHAQQRKKKRPVGTDLIKQVAQNTDDIKQILEILGGRASVGPDAPNGDAIGPAGA